MDSQLDMTMVHIFAQAKAEINKSFFTMKKKAFLDFVGSIVGELAGKFGEWSGIRIMQEYLQGASKIIPIDVQTMKAMTKDELVLFAKSVLSTPHILAIDSQILQANSIMQQSLSGLTKNIQWKLGEIGRVEVTASLSNIESMQKAKDKIIDIYTKKGITSFRDIGGKQRDLQNYADMVVRTETGVANVRGTVNTAIEAGYTKFVRVEKNDSCPICAPHDGELWNTSKQGPPTPEKYHPRCRGSRDVVVD